MKEKQKRAHYIDEPVDLAASRSSAVSTPQRVALIDGRGTIVAVNKEWLDLVEKSGAQASRTGPGANYLEVCRESSRSCEDSRRALDGIQAVLKGKTSSFAMDYECKGLSRSHFRMHVTPFLHGAELAITHTDITDLQLKNENDCKRLQQFARRLIHAQEAERQRIGREIHDDLGNRTALVSLSLRQFIKQTPENTEAARELNKALRDLFDLSTALRDLSHWLHSPTLRHLGVGAALKSLQEMFEKTHKIRMNVVLPASLPRLPDEVELCVYRISQECLQNVAKHSDADEVKIVLEYKHKQLQLTITDAGRGFDPLKALQEGGLGLLSMEERAQSVCGQLAVNSSPGAGSEVRLTIPLQQDSAASMAR